MPNKSLAGMPVNWVRDRLQQATKQAVFKPAKIYTQFLFVATIAGLVATVFAGWTVFINLGLDGLIANAWWLAVLAYTIGWGFSKATVDYTIANGFFIFEGDLGLVNLDSLEMKHPILAQHTFPVNSEERKRHYAPQLWGKLITRFEVWRHGKRGGNWKWPFWDGGKKEGFWGVVQHAWDVADVQCKECPDCAWPEIRQPKLHYCFGCGQSLRISPGEIKPLNHCPECGSAKMADAKPRLSTKVVSGSPLATYQQDGKSFLTPEVVDRIRSTLPGVLRGRVLDLRYTMWPNRSPVELPEEVMIAIMNDPLWRVTSPVTVGYDPLPGEVGLGTVAPPNALVELWGYQVASKLLRFEYNELNKYVAKMRLLQEIQLTGGGFGGSTGTPPEQPAK